MYHFYLKRYCISFGWVFEKRILWLVKFYGLYYFRIIYKIYIEEKSVDYVIVRKIELTTSRVFSLRLCVFWGRKCFLFLLTVVCFLQCGKAVLCIVYGQVWSSTYVNTVEVFWSYKVLSFKENKEWEYFSRRNTIC